MEKALRSGAPLSKTQEDYWLELKFAWSALNDALQLYERDTALTMIEAAKIIFNAEEEREL